MIVAKRAADLITWSRSLLALGFVWLGFTQGTAALPLAILLMIASWTLDSLDGPLARRSSVRYRSWIGDHDIEVDMTVAAGLLAYMAAAGIVTWAAVFIYFGLALVLLRLVHNHREMSKLVQVPVYGMFIWIATRDEPGSAIWLYAWALAAILATWPKLPKVIIPTFLNGLSEMREILTGQQLKE